MEEKLSNGQKVMFLVLCALIALMIVFSAVSAKNNSGKLGYDKCINWKCDKKGQEYCTKTRELNNCCSGAGGQLAQNEEGIICVFSK